MGKETFEALLSSQQDNAIKFEDLRILLQQLGFRERIKGDHYIYKMDRLPERVNIQPDGNMAKGYQVMQIRGIIKKYGLEAK
jgi:predicted RNA binding protein YcfA (HicA-like mRNA interferase family)